MPTRRYGKVRRLLKEGKAKVVRRTPFTIQLLYDTTEYVQDVTLGVDAGYSKVGISATTKEKVLFEGEAELRNDVVNLLSTRRQFRRGRRSRKTRYRKARFLNRRKSDGWIAPSVRHKIKSHLKLVELARSILPISRVVIEVAVFDIQKIQNPNIEGVEYQQGKQMGFWNVREYVLWRDQHTCQGCRGKSGDKVLNVHHIESRKVGGDSPDNLLTLCETCHEKHHRGGLEIGFKRGQPLKATAFMGIMRWELYDTLKEMYPGRVFLTYEYITKGTRIENGLPKSHYVDARCIAGNPKAKENNEIFQIKFVRNQNRSLHKSNPSKGGKRKINTIRESKGFRRFDKVLYGETVVSIHGLRSSGYFDLRKLEGTKISPSLSWKKLKLLERNGTMLIERRNVAVSSPC